jgi:hypothetical protein
MSRDICVNDVPRHHITLTVTNYAEITEHGRVRVSVKLAG